MHLKIGLPEVGRPPQGNGVLQGSELAALCLHGSLMKHKQRPPPCGVCVCVCCEERKGNHKRNCLPQVELWHVSRDIIFFFDQ